MRPARKPWWQQATALVSLSAGGAVTGFSFAPATPAHLASPAGMPIRLMALEHAAQQSASPDAGTADAALRSAIVNVARYYLRMAQSRTPAEMSALIWRYDSTDGAGHGPSCAAFASLTLELASHVVGEESWVSGGTSYPWPLHEWADVRVEPNPDSPGITSILQDAEAHRRWHPLGDGYRPLPGDWVLFDGHVEVVTRYSAGALRTIGADSGPDLSVNEHTYRNPVSAQGVLGFVNNGGLAAAAGAGAGSHGAGGGSHGPGTGGNVRSGGAGLAAIPGEAAADPGEATASAPRPAGGSRPGLSAIPGTTAAAPATGAASPSAPAPAAGQDRTQPHPGQAGPPRTGTGHAGAGQGGSADVPGAAPAAAGATPQAAPGTAAPGTAAVPGVVVPGPGSAGRQPSPAPYRRHQPPPSTAPIQDITDQQTFIQEVAPGAIAAQRHYGVPAAVTIAQAIDESGWGQSELAAKDHNLFGIKGVGPDGSDPLPTQEYENGQWVTITTLFRVYHNVAESIDDHGRTIAESGYYGRAMAERNDPNAFANALTGVYATSPDYGHNLISLMQQYNLYRYGMNPQAGKAAPARNPGRTPDSAQPGRTPSGAAGGVTHAPSPGPGQARQSPAPASQSPARARSSRQPAAARRGRQASPSPSGTAAPAQAPAPSVTTSTPDAPAGGAAVPGVDGLPHAVGTSAFAYSGTAPSGTASSGLPAPGTPSSGTASSTVPASGMASSSAPASGSAASVAATPLSATPAPPASAAPAAAPPTGTRASRTSAARRRHKPHLPLAVEQAFITKAKVPLLQAEPLYRDVASHSGLSWELLAACDWMQCNAQPRHSPVHGEKLGTVNPDGTVYQTKSEALEQCAEDLVELAGTVYGTDLTAPGALSVHGLANVFAAFRWGGLLKLHRTSAMEFPYSVAGLTAQHLNMRWPKINEPNAPDKPGTRFRRPFGAVPIVLSLDYPVRV